MGNNSYKAETLRCMEWNMTWDYMLNELWWEWGDGETDHGVVDRSLEFSDTENELGEPVGSWKSQRVGRIVHCLGKF